MMSIFFCFRQELLRGIFEHDTKPKLKTTKYRCRRIIQNVLWSTETEYSL